MHSARRRTPTMVVTTQIHILTVQETKSHRQGNEQHGCHGYRPIGSILYHITVRACGESSKGSCHNIRKCRYDQDQHQPMQTR